MLPTSTAMRRRRAVGVTVALLLAACGGEQGPTQPAPLAFAAVSTGFEHTCGLAAAGALYCWGANSFGKLGDGTMSDRSSPVRVMGGVNFAAVSAGGHHTCAVTGAGTAYCWGFNNEGQLGDGTTSNRSSPVPVAGALKFAAVSAGAYHTCAVTAAGAADCWGWNSSGQLGDGTTTQHLDRKSTRLNSSHTVISYAVFCLKKKRPRSR